MRRFVALASLVCVAAIAFAAVSAASTTKFAVHSTIKKSGGKIAGTLSSPKAKCIKDRTIQVGYRLAGSGGGQAFILHPDESGRWKVNYDLSGRGRALVDVVIRELTISNKPHHHKVCKAAHEQKVLDF